MNVYFNFFLDDTDDEETEDSLNKSIFSKYNGIIVMLLEVSNKNITDSSKIITFDDVAKAGRDYFRRKMENRLKKK